MRDGQRNRPSRRTLELSTERTETVASAGLVPISVKPHIAGRKAMKNPGGGMDELLPAEGACTHGRDTQRYLAPIDGWD